MRGVFAFRWILLVALCLVRVRLAAKNMSVAPNKRGRFCRQIVSFWHVSVSQRPHRRYFTYATYALNQFHNYPGQTIQLCDIVRPQLLEDTRRADSGVITRNQISRVVDGSFEQRVVR